MVWAWASGETRARSSSRTRWPAATAVAVITWLVLAAVPTGGIAQAIGRVAYGRGLIGMLTAWAATVSVIPAEYRGICRMWSPKTREMTLDNRPSRTLFSGYFQGEFAGPRGHRSAFGAATLSWRSLGFKSGARDDVSTKGRLTSGGTLVSRVQIPVGGRLLGERLGSGCPEKTSATLQFRASRGSQSPLSRTRSFCPKAPAGAAAFLSGRRCR